MESGRTIDAVIFDLDGVLWDTTVACVIAWNNVVRRNKIDFREITNEDMQKVTGQSHENCIRNTFVGLSENILQLIMRETVVEDNVMVQELGGDLYRGVREGITALSTKYPLAIVSNCQSGYIEIFLEKNQFGKYFKDIECWGNTKETKGKNVRRVIERNEFKHPIYVGDTNGDLMAAKECGIPFWHVTYGFGKCAEYQKIFDSFPDLVRALH